MDNRIIRFDWAAKRLLCNKANFGVLEGFLTVLLNEKITIIEILESEGNRIHADNKLNRVDIKARNSKDEIVIIEIQNTCEAWYLEHILYRMAKPLTEHINPRKRYDSVKKCTASIYCTSIWAREKITFTTGKTPSWACIRVTNC